MWATAVMITSAKRIYLHDISARGRKTAPARKALEKSRAPLTIDENDSGYNQESEANVDDDEFTGENKLEEDEEVEDEDSDVKMEDNELLNEVSLSISKYAFGYSPS